MKLTLPHLMFLHFAAAPGTSLLPPATGTAPQGGMYLEGEAPPAVRDLGAEGYIELTSEPANNRFHIIITPLGLSKFYMHHPQRKPAASPCPPETIHR